MYLYLTKLLDVTDVVMLGFFVVHVYIYPTKKGTQHAELINSQEGHKRLASFVYIGAKVYRFLHHYILFQTRGMTDFSGQFRKIIMRYKRIGYTLKEMRQSACLVISPITVDGYAALFNCTPVDRALDSMMAPT